MSVPLVPLNDGRAIPQIGLGVYKIGDDEAARTVATALEAGYRHIDTATLYGNERGVGEGIRASGLPREQVFVTTKVWNDDHGFDETLEAFDRSLELLGTDYVDLYLVHWPIPSRDRYVDTYRALERIRQEGRARSIGVSNFAIEHLERLLGETEVVPVINQVELHPRLPQDELRAFDTAHGIVTQAWSPLARGRLLDEPALASIAAKHGVSPAQVVLRWHVQLGVVVIPKSVTPARIRENLDLFGFALDAEDLAGISALATGERTGRDPSLD
ncbi:aldo/keto reductase [Rathayibacter festucae]|uniref:Aldo/keto reductase n=1 Tax=Rathayibacter festucae TaxID=110937 RepID=A0ABX6GX39_9MICO|nr:aldo/keto reductase [Rathayibacter festucae]QHC62096.1 aldo/keto reductase [Rathayibacter festucae]